MLKDIVREIYENQDLNCAETVLYAANQEYKLGLDEKALKLAAGFGGGMAIEDKCGALTGAIMVLGVIFVKEKAHESDKIKVLTKELLKRYQEEMGSIDCAPLKEKYRDDIIKCRDIIDKAAEILDSIIKQEKNTI